VDEGPLSGQRWDPSAYSEHARFVSDLGAPAVDLLAPKPGERILDLGCGDGALTESIAAAGASVVGVDSSEEMVAGARRRGLDARLADARKLEFEDEFDAVFSNAALHWMREPDAVIAGVHRALRPGGRFVAEMGGHGCVAAITLGLVAVLSRRGIDAMKLRPWYFPTAAEYGAKLRSAGFVLDEIVLFPRGTILPGALEDWLDTFARPFVADVPREEHRAVFSEVARMLAPMLRDEQGVWTADYVRLRFAARRN
jgi:trans-aconitate methyltransferase